MHFRGKAIIYGKRRKYGIVSGYRPHLAEKDSDELYGIVFTEVSETVVDKFFDCVIMTPYENVDYSILQLNEIYDIREGAKSVGEIVLIERIHSELEVVKSTRNLSEKVSCDCIGTIVMVHTSPRVAYEVEFVDAQGNTLEILTVEEKDIVASNMRR